MTDTYARTWTVRFSDTDMAQIAHYPRIVDAVHETADMFMEEAGFPLWQTYEEGFGLPIVEANFEFERPMEAGDEVTISLVPSLGERSVRFDFEATCDGETTFTAYEQRVCLEAGADSAMALPEEVRAAIAPYARE